MTPKHPKPSREEKALEKRIYRAMWEHGHKSLPDLLKTFARQESRRAVRKKLKEVAGLGCNHGCPKNHCGDMDRILSLIQKGRKS